MIEIIEKYKNNILNFTEIHSKKDDKISEYKGRITFLDGSILEFTEIIVFEISKRKYSFQWMDSNYSLITRWDNALHHSHIPTFPHHKHVGENEIESSQERFLEDILIEISLSFENKI
jgi:hypothetical protein